MTVKKSFLRSQKESSVILSYISAFTAFLTKHFDRSLFGLVATESEQTSELFESSATGGLIDGQSRRTSGVKRLFRFIASGFENSFFASLVKGCYKTFLNLGMKSVGQFFASFALFSLFAWIIIGIVDPQSSSYSDLVVIIGVGAAALPLCFSKRSVIECISSSRFLGGLLRKNLGVDTEMALRRVKNNRSLHKLEDIAPVLGIVVGTFTVFFSPLSFLLLGLSVIIFMFLLAVPEAGIVALIAMIPFSVIWPIGRESLFWLIIASSVGYLGKLVRGKRFFSLDFIDIAVFSLFLIMASSCFGNAESYNAAGVAVIFLLTYFVFINVIKNRTWQNRVAKALVFMWIFTAFFGIVSALIEEIPFLSDFLSVLHISDLAFVFGRSGGSVYILLPAIPFLLASASETKDGWKRNGYFVFSVLIFLCIYIGGNQMPLLPLAVGITSYVLMTVPSAVFFLILAMLIVFGFGGMKLPLVSDMLRKSAEFAESTMFENKYKRGGVIRLLEDYFFTGIGRGDDTFGKVYPDYSYPGFEGATDSGSALLDFLLGYGFLGALIFLIIIFAFFRESMSFVKNARSASTSDKRYISAAMSGVLMFAVAGIRDNVAEFDILYLIMWIMLALGMSYVKAEKYERYRVGIRHPSTPERADAEMEYVGVSRSTK